MEFKCSSCGACCLVAGGKFGLRNRGDGGCSFLNNKNQCSIYEFRPNICRVDKMYNIRKKNNEHNLSKKQYYIKNTIACHKLIDFLKLDKSYKIPIKEYNK